jgi:hypothetical protein
LQKKYTFLNNNSKKILLAVFISMIWITTLTPMVLAINTKISVTFDPDGSVTIDVWPNSWAAGVVMAGENKTSGAADFTVWNNGTSAMDIQLQTNATSDAPGSMTYNPAALPGADEFSLNTTGFTSSAGNYIPINAYTIDYHTINGGGTSKTFGLRITIGSTLTTNLSTQRIEIRFNGVSV